MKQIVVPGSRQIKLLTTLARTRSIGKLIQLPVCSGHSLDRVTHKKSCRAGRSVLVPVVR